MKNRNLLLTLLLSIGASQYAKAQNFTTYGPPNAINMTNNPYANYPGSTFLLDNFSNAKVTMTDGRVYDNLKINYDIIGERILFYNPDLKIDQVFAEAPFSFIISDLNEQNKRIFIRGEKTKGLNPKVYYEILTNGRMILLKEYSRKIIEGRQDNSILTTKIIEPGQKYYLQTPQNTISIRLDEKNIIDAMVDKKEKIKEFISNQKLKLKNEKNVIEVINYYNSL